MWRRWIIEVGVLCGLILLLNCETLVGLIWLEGINMSIEVDEGPILRSLVIGLTKN